MLNTAGINNSLVRNVKAKVEFFQGSTLVDTFKHDGALQEITIDRIGEDSKFFGFGICQKINMKLRDKDRSINFPSQSSLKVYFNDVMTNPIFYITEVNRDEKTNRLSITGYDAIEKSKEHFVSELALAAPYTIKQFAEACISLMGFKGLIIKNIPDTDLCFETSYPTGANFEGTETVRDALNDIAEATQTVYYLDHSENLVFKRLDQTGKAALTIDKSLYIELSSKTNRRITAVCHATELGDNVIAQGTEMGSTQYVRDNPFWDLREDIDTLVNNALAAVNGLTINQFSCNWRGDYRLEIADKIALVTKDNKKVYSYLLNDSIKYNGAYAQESEWKYSDSEESAANPSTLGEALKQTFAKVDKANKQVDIVVSKVDGYDDKISSLQLTTDGIQTTVQQIKTNTDNSIDSVNQSIDTLTQQVNSKVTPEDLTIEVKKQIDNGVSSVTTTTGFEFNQEGLKISKAGKEMSTQITEDGMTVYKDNNSVLTANNAGVDAVNLHATTYLIIGKNSRLEDYGDNQTGCFWIGK